MTKPHPPRLIALPGGGRLELGPTVPDDYLGELADDLGGEVLPAGAVWHSPPPAPEGAQLAAALVRALADVTVIEANRKATIPGKDGRSGYSYDFANIGDVIQATRGPLAREGIVALTPVSTVDGGALQVTVELIHTSGERRVFDPIVFASSRDPQAAGSAITYFRRYALMSALGIGIGEEDDGGEGAATAAQRPATASQRSSAMGTARKAAPPRQEAPKPPTLEELVAPVVAEHGPEFGAAVTRLLERMGDPALPVATRKAIKDGFVAELGVTPLALKPEQLAWAEAWVETELAPLEPSASDQDRAAAEAPSDGMAGDPA